MYVRKNNTLCLGFDALNTPIGVALMYDKFFEGSNVALISALLRTDLIACY